MLCTLYELSEGASLDYWALSSPPNPSVSKIWICMSGPLRSNMATWAVLKFTPRRRPNDDNMRLKKEKFQVTQLFIGMRLNL